MSLFFRAKLSCNIFTFILKNSIKAVELEKKKKKHQIRLSLNHSSKTTQYPTTEQTLVSFFQPPPSPVLSLRCVFFSIFQSSPTQYLSAGKGQTYYTSPNKTQDHQPIQEIQEPGETYQICLHSEKVYRCKGALLVTKAPSSSF